MTPPLYYQCPHYCYQVMANGTLLVMRVQPSDRGEYKCQAINLMGTSVTSVLVSYLGDPGLIFTCSVAIEICTNCNVIVVVCPHIMT